MKLIISNTTPVSGYLHNFWLQWSADLPEAFVILGYAFYVQPMLMPLLHEMPAGQLGVHLVTKAVRYVTLGAGSGSDAVALLLPFAAGAARWLLSLMYLP